MKDRAFRQGYLDTRFPVEPFDSVPRLLMRTGALYAANLPFIAGVTLLVFLPATLLLQFAYSLLEIPNNSLVSYLLMSASDLVFSALVTPAILYGLTVELRDGKLPPVGECLRWGRRQFRKMLWNTLKMEISILLSSLLLLIPGIMTAIALIFTETIVAVEGDSTADVRNRSKSLAAGHGWRIFFAMLPLTLIGTAALMLFEGAGKSRIWLAAADSLVTVVNQIETVAALLIYLALVREAGNSPRQ